MEIKVRCQCGSVYSFDENPVNGRVQYPVSCTNCGADGTEKANAYIAAKLNGGTDPTADAGQKGWFSRIKKKSAPTEPEEAETSGVFDDEARRLVLAILGALGVGALGAFGWLMLAKATGYEFGYVAWALGGIVGITTRMLVPGGHHWAGRIGAVAALVAIGGGELLTAKWTINELGRVFVTASTTQAERYAREAAAATTDAELLSPAARYKLAVLVAGEHPTGPLATLQSFQLEDSLFVIGQIIEREHPIVLFAKQREAAEESNVTPKELAQFKIKVLPALKKLAAGNPSEEEYQASLLKMLNSRVTLKSLIFASMGPFSWVWIVLGIATAYKVSSKE